MKHLAIPARSVNDPSRPYTCAGLGDRIHTATIGWAYGWGDPVTLHLTGDKLIGGQFGNKPESWDEIVSLFPVGSVTLQKHAISPQSEAEWLRHLGCVASYWYADYPGKHERRAGIDISRYLRSFPLLEAEPQDIQLPDRFVTAQWDAGGPSRAVPQGQRPVYDCEMLIVGGEATDERLRWSLKHIAYAMSKAECHVGVDSAFMHMAQLYMEPERIHLYGTPHSHHMKRALDRGAKLCRLS